MRRGYLDFTSEFAREIGIGGLPTTWKIIGSLVSPVKGVVRLVLENEHVADGPDAVITVEITDTPFERKIVVLLDGQPVTC